MASVYKTTQFFFAFLYWLLSKFWFKLETRGAENLEGLKGPIIMVSNHKSFGDHFLIFAAMPKQWRSQLLPVRAMASDKLYSNWLKRFFMGFLGTYPSLRGQGFALSLAKPLEILKGGGIVGFYPEGVRVRGEGIGEFKRGIGELVKRAPGIPVLPIVIRGTQDLLLQVLPRPFSRIYVNFGKPFYPDLAQSSEAITAAVREKVLELYNNAV